MGFSAFMAPDSHIDFLAQHPGLVHDYIGGKPPQSTGPDAVPDGWPSQELESLGGWGINHGNVDLYHWILNGSPEPVAGSGSIFQTWYLPDQHAAVHLDKLNERFGFRAAQLEELAALAEAVSVDSVLRAFSDWCKSQGKRYDDLDQYACQPFVDEFSMFAQGLREAIRRGYGIIW